MKVATREVPVLTIVWFRFSFAFLFLALFVARRRAGRLRVLVRPPLLGVLAALALTLNYIGYLAGLDRTTPSNAQILIQTAPLMLALIGVFFFKERMNRGQVVGVLVALSGFFLFALDQHHSRSVAASTFWTGNLIIFGAALAWALYAALQKVLTQRGHAPQDLNLVFYLLPALLLVPWADFGVLRELSLGLWLLMAFLGANTLLAYGFLGEALERLPAWQVSLIITLNPLITLASMAVLGALELDWVPADHVGTLGYGAALMVVGGVVWVLLKATPEPKNPEPVSAP
jgi:drug/metabolite transporter (DMT)-like permease